MKSFSLFRIFLGISFSVILMFVFAGLNTVSAYTYDYELVPNNTVEHDFSAIGDIQLWTVDILGNTFIYRTDTDLVYMYDSAWNLEATSYNTYPTPPAEMEADDYGGVVLWFPNATPNDSELLALYIDPEGAPDKLIEGGSLSPTLSCADTDCAIGNGFAQEDNMYYYFTYYQGGTGAHYEVYQIYYSSETITTLVMDSIATAPVSLTVNETDGFIYVNVETTLEDDYQVLSADLTDFDPVIPLAPVEADQVSHGGPNPSGMAVDDNGSIYLYDATGGSETAGAILVYDPPDGAFASVYSTYDVKYLHSLQYDGINILGLDIRDVSSLVTRQIGFNSYDGMPFPLTPLYDNWPGNAVTLSPTPIGGKNEDGTTQLNEDLTLTTAGVTVGATSWYYYDNDTARTVSVDVCDNNFSNGEIAIAVWTTTTSGLSTAHVGTMSEINSAYKTGCGDTDGAYLEFSADADTEYFISVSGYDDGDAVEGTYDLIVDEAPTHRNGLTWCDGHGGLAELMPSPGPVNWAECLAWCDTVMNSTTLPLCQWNGDWDTCGVNHAPGYVEEVDNGNVYYCDWKTGTPDPYGAWYTGFEDTPPTPSPGPSTPPATTVPPTPPPPDNNYFTNAWTITMDETQDVLELDNADLEEDEPVNVQNKTEFEMRKTKWWKYVAAGSGYVSFDTCNDNVGMETSMAVYTGTELTDLEKVGDNRAGCWLNSNEMYGSTIYLNVTEGTTYYIQISNIYDTELQTTSLHVDDSAVEPTPLPNDNFADAAAPIVDELRDNGDYEFNEVATHGATTEVDEPNINSSSSDVNRGLIERTVWYTWTNGGTQKTMWLDTCTWGFGGNTPGDPGPEGDDSDSLIDVYRPDDQETPSLTGLTRVATNDNWNTPDQTDHWGCMWQTYSSFIDFVAEPNTVYYIRVSERSDMNTNPTYPRFLTFRTHPEESARLSQANTPDGMLLCDNGWSHVKRTIPYELAQGGQTRDGWNDCWAWCSSVMTDEASLCQMNGDGSRVCAVKWTPTGGLDNCVWSRVSSESPWPMGGYLGQNSGHIMHLPAGMGAVLANQPEVDVTVDGQTGSRLVQLREINDVNVPLADIVVDFSEDRDWTSTVGGGAEPGFGKSFTHSLTTAPGAADNFDMYVPIPQGATSSSLIICPGAESFDEVNLGCDSIETLLITDERVEKVTVNGVEYWKISEVTGTGGQTIITDFNVYDTMTREEMSEDSNHDIFFGTTYGVNVSGDTVVLTFPLAFDLTNLIFGDLSFVANGTPLTLNDGAAGVNTWGVNINKTTNVITFTAPTSGTGYIPLNTILEIKIFNATTAPIKNPATVGGYSIGLQINNPGAEGGPEDGTIDIPIVDSDQVMITGYVDNYIHFDIDVGNSAAVDCAFDACKIHSGGANGGNYTVDLGEMSWMDVNKSRDSVIHSDTNMGMINSIYFDLTSNGIGGSVVNVISTNGNLTGPGSNTIDPVAVDGNNIVSNSNSYGFNMSVEPSSAHGLVVVNSDCNTTSKYCGPSSSTQKLIFNTNGYPIDQARVRMDIAAAPAFTSNPGTYTDTLTFVATSTF